MTTLIQAFRIPMAGALLGAAALSSSACGIDLMAQEEARDTLSRRYTIERGATVEIVGTNGRIEVLTGPGDTVDVKAERIVKASTEAKAKEELGKVEIKESATPTHVRLDSSTRGLNLGVNRVVNYTVTVPAWANVTLETTNGDITVDGLSGELRVTATNGRIKATSLENGAMVDTTNGAVSLDFASLGAQGVECETINGRITITLPRDGSADVSARVTNGRISAENLDLSITEESRRRLDGRLGSGSTRVRLETVNGAIDLRGR